LAQKKMSSKGGWEGIDKGGICITQCRILSSFVNFKRRRYWANPEKAILYPKCRHCETQLTMHECINFET
jgi:hypothetical protein